MNPRMCVACGRDAARECGVEKNVAQWAPGVDPKWKKCGSPLCAECIHVEGGNGHIYHLRPEKEKP